MKESHEENYGDRRPKEFQKSEEGRISDAPTGVLDIMQPALPKSKPDGPVIGDTTPDMED